MGRLRASSQCTHPPLHPPPLLLHPPSSLHLPPPLPTSLLPPLPASLSIPPLVDHREETPEAELPPRKRLCLTTLTSRYEVGESLTAAPRPAGGHGIDYRFIGTLDAKTKCQRADEVAMGLKIFSSPEKRAVREEYLRIDYTQLFLGVDGLDQDGQDNYQQYWDRFRRFKLENNMPPRRSSATARAVAPAAAAPMTAATIEQVIEARVSAAIDNHETLRNNTNGHGDGSHNSGTRNRGTTRTLRECTYKDFLNCHPLNFKGTEGVVVLAQWFENMESILHISNCAMENQVKFATCTFVGNALTWWNSHIKAVTQDVAYAMD
ncbi:hypothetical protein Tco_0590954 [Tanacetum coccineum]